MSSSDLSTLYRLHKVDLAIHEIKARVAALPRGEAEKAAIQRLKPEHDAAKEAYQTCSGNVTDAELLQKDLSDKIDKIEKLLYGGSLVSSREIEAYQKEQAMFRRQKEESEIQAMEWLEELPGLKKKYEDLHKQMVQLQIAGKAVVEKSMAARDQLEAEYKKVTALRPGLAEKVTKPMLVQYDAIRQKAGGVGMAEITPKSTCGMCGMTLPEKAIELARMDKLVSCESCRRILILVVPGV